MPPGTTTAEPRRARTAPAARRVNGLRVIADDPIPSPLPPKADGSPRVFRNRRLLTLEDQSTVYGCGRCRETFATRSGLQTHESRQHPPPGGRKKVARKDGSGDTPPASATADQPAPPVEPPAPVVVEAPAPAVVAGPPAPPPEKITVADRDQGAVLRRIRDCNVGQLLDLLALAADWDAGVETLEQALAALRGRAEAADKLAHNLQLAETELGVWRARARDAEAWRRRVIKQLGPLGFQVATEGDN